MLELVKTIWLLVVAGIGALIFVTILLLLAGLIVGVIKGE